ncbi:hypothetical protein [Halomarina ordinaria]|uniref:Sulfatase-like hydrolase/transferase n=1 Tax=Halomarina ordinaria TaxID=3033939 RepID=A0ABD5U3Q6_9EURY|nr:hypothetical protein [Halomarina sp. PSRA2]
MGSDSPPSRPARIVDALSYAVRELREHYRDPEWRYNRVVTRVDGPVSRLRYGDGGVDLPAAEWDNLLVLDSCRADLFETVADLARFDDYRRATSVASMTAEWTRKTWADREFGDIVYVNANPLVSRWAPDSFHRLVDLWDEAFDEGIGTVPPEATADAAREAFEDDKRLVVHFVQPHAPFYPASLGVDDSAAAWAPGGGEGAHPDATTPWKALRDGTTTFDAVWEGYAATLSAGLEAALALVDDLPGRTVLTSDHGNLYGQRVWPLGRPVYGHPPNLRHPGLVEVPWAVVDGEPRETVDDGVTSAAEADEETMRDRLAALGYV